MPRIAGLIVKEEEAIYHEEVGQDLSDKEEDFWDKSPQRPF